MGEPSLCKGAHTPLSRNSNSCGNPHFSAGEIKDSRQSEKFLGRGSGSPLCLEVTGRACPIPPPLNTHSYYLHWPQLCTTKPLAFWHCGFVMVLHFLLTQHLTMKSSLARINEPVIIKATSTANSSNLFILFLLPWARISKYAGASMGGGSSCQVKKMANSLKPHMKCARIHEQRYFSQNSETTRLRRWSRIPVTRGLDRPPFINRTDYVSSYSPDHCNVTAPGFCRPAVLH